MAQHNFCISGPTHFVGTTINWDNAHHRRIIMASLVKGVYTLKDDTKNGRVGKQALAPQWWECFNFKKTEELRDPRCGTIFGAIFKFHSANDHNYYSASWYNVSTSHSSTIRPAPKYVIAFRGTSLTKDSASQDLKLDSKCILNLVHQSSRVGVAMSAVERAVEKNLVDPTTIWLAGHSLGAAVALSVGKDIVLNKNVRLETYLFNPPCAHFPVATLGTKSPILKRVIRFSRTIATAAVATVQGFHEDETSEFSQLLEWIPYMFVNEKDRISNEYIEYFKHRERMARVGLEKIERVATQNSITSLIPGARPSHLLPAACICSNLSPDIVNFREAHALKQWWVPQQHYFESKLYDKFWHV